MTQRYTEALTDIKNAELTQLAKLKVECGRHTSDYGYAARTKLRALVPKDHFLYAACQVAADQLQSRRKEDGYPQLTIPQHVHELFRRGLEFLRATGGDYDVVPHETDGRGPWLSMHKFSFACLATERSRAVNAWTVWDKLRSHILKYESAEKDRKKEHSEEQGSEEQGSEERACVKHLVAVWNSDGKPLSVIECQAQDDDEALEIAADKHRTYSDFDMNFNPYIAAITRCEPGRETMTTR